MWGFCFVQKNQRRYDGDSTEPVSIYTTPFRTGVQGPKKRSIPRKNHQFMVLPGVARQPPWNQRSLQDWTSGEAGCRAVEQAAAGTALCQPGVRLCCLAARQAETVAAVLDLPLTQELLLPLVEVQSGW